MSCGIEETQLGPRAAGSRQASDRALDDQAAGAQHISLSEARRRVPASSAPHRKQLAGAEHGLCQIRPVENSKPFRCPRDWPPKTREPRPVARRARGSRVVILPGRILLRRAPLAERTRTKRRWFPASPQTIRLSADSAALEGGFWSCLKGLSLSRWRSATHPSIPGDLILAASTMALRPLYSMNRSWAAHNGLVGGSSPPGPTTHSDTNRRFPVSDQ